MPVYEYTALDRTGKRRKGIIDADNPVAARAKLKSSDIFPVEVKITSSRHKVQPAGQVSLTSLFGRVNSGELSAMTRQLSILLKAGVPLVSSLEAIISQASNTLLKKIMAQIKESVNEGNSLASSISNHPKLFSQVYTNMVRAGEASGALDLVLERLAEFSEHQEALKGRIRAALAYPIFMSIVGVLVLFFLVAFIVPNITKIFNDMEQALPLATVILINTSDFLKAFWWLVLAFIIFAFILLGRFKKTPKGKYLWNRIKIHTPIVGDINIKIAVGRFGRTLGSLLQSGVPLLTALEIVKNVVNNILIADIIDKAIEDIQSGKNLSVSLSGSNLIPPVAVQMISIGEQSGELEKMLHNIADIYEREVESRVMAMTSMLEPVMILIMGIIVGFIVISILIPIFEMSRMIR